MAKKDPIPKKLFQLLVCPKCRGKIDYTKDKTGLICKKCSAEYEIKNGIPIMM